MGMPISLALRGRHTDDGAARAAWAATMTVLHEVDRVFSTYRPESFVSRLGRGEIGLEDCPPEVVEVIELGAAAERESGGAFSIRLPDPHGTRLLDPTGVVKGWAAERAAEPLRALPILVQETLKAQSASIDMVSGATYTSDGYVTSLQSALDQAGL